MVRALFGGRETYEIACRSSLMIRFAIPQARDVRDSCRSSRM